MGQRHRKVERTPDSVWVLGFRVQGIGVCLREFGFWVLGLGSYGSGVRV